jgi:glycosyltransferase involved in cell wall biosynthesis
MRLLMIIPAYNEEDNIVRVVNNIIEQYPEYDYVVINDGSTDHTSRRCHKQGFEIIDLPANLGLAGAFQTGLKYAYRKGYDCALQFDADGQHKPEYIKQMLDKMEEGYDIVIGSRYYKKAKEQTVRMLGSRILTKAILWTTGKKILDPTSGMRMFNRAMIKEFAINVNYGPEPDTISYLAKQGAKIAEVQVKMDERVSGTSYLTVTKSAMYMFRMLVSIFFIQNFRKRDAKHVVMKRK